VLPPPPPNRLAITEIKPPSPAMLLSPPLKALETPPDTVCFSKLPQTLLDCDEVVVLVLDGEPNLIPDGTTFAVSDEVRVSCALGGLTVFSLPACKVVSTLAGVSSLSMLCPFIFGAVSRLNLPDKLLLRFATLFLHSPRLF
jgi:hypothetical protein